MPFEQARQIFGALASLGDYSDLYGAKLRQAGFSAFVPIQNFVASFCASAAERETHADCKREEIKERLGTPWPPDIGHDPPGGVYSSPRLEALIRARDEANGCTADELRARHPGEVWRIEVDPCLRRMARIRLSDATDYDEHWVQTLAARTRSIQAEVLLHCPHEWSGINQNDPSAICCATLERYAFAMGFRPSDPKQGWSGILTKDAAANWAFCIAVDCGDGDHGAVEVALHLLRRQPRQKRAGLSIRYTHLVPGFSTAYCRFDGLNELQIALQAHLVLMSFFLADFEPLLARISAAVR